MKELTYLYYMEYKTNELPRYEHDCSKCIFIGTYKNADQYLHMYENYHLMSLISRYSSDGPDYSSGNFYFSNEYTNALLKVVVENKLLPKEYLKQIYAEQKEWFRYLEKDSKYKKDIIKEWENKERFLLKEEDIQ